MTTVDLSMLPTDLQTTAQIDTNGEVRWPLHLAAAAINALADSGIFVLGLDLRDYQADGTFVELAWSDFSRTLTSPSQATVDEARTDALAAIARAGEHQWTQPWMVVTWRKGT